MIDGHNWFCLHFPTFLPVCSLHLSLPSFSLPCLFADSCKLAIELLLRAQFACRIISLALPAFIWSVCTSVCESLTSINLVCRPVNLPIDRLACASVSRSYHLVPLIAAMTCLSIVCVYRSMSASAWLQCTVHFVIRPVSPAYRQLVRFG